MSGNYLPEGQQTLAPILQFPIADKIGLPGGQQGNICGLFEMQFWKCMEAFGTKLGRLYCDLEHRDYKECMSKDKQFRRVEAIRRERFRKYIRGELKEQYEKDHIKMGQLRADYYSWDLINPPGRH